MPKKSNKKTKQEESKEIEKANSREAPSKKLLGVFDKEPKKEVSKPKLRLVVRDVPEDEFEEFFEEEIGNENFVRTRAPKPFLESRPIINLERDLAEVPITTKKEDEDDNPNIGYSNIKSGYASANLYSSDNQNSQSNQVMPYTPGVALGKTDILAPREQAIDFQRWQETNLDYPGQSNQQERYQFTPKDRLEEDKTNPWETKKDKKFGF